MEYNLPSAVECQAVEAEVVVHQGAMVHEVLADTELWVDVFGSTCVIFAVVAAVPALLAVVLVTQQGQLEELSQ